MNKFRHFLKQRDVLIVSKFACIKVHAMLGADLVADVGLVGIFDVLHRLAAARAGAVRNIIIRLSGLGITGVEKFRHPFVFEAFSFAKIEPQPLAARASVDGHVPAIGCFFHCGITFRAFHGSFLN